MSYLQTLRREKRVFFYIIQGVWKVLCLESVFCLESFCANECLKHLSFSKIFIRIKQIPVIAILQ